MCTRSLEQWNGTDRDHFNAVVTDQDLVDTYTPVFQACASEARASGIMCSYNEVNGIPSCANDFLLTELMRNQWGFNGYITSDCGAVSDVQYTHNYTSTTDETCNVVMTSGMDIGCDGFLPPNLPQALNDNAVTLADIDTALTNLFMVRMRLGQFDPPSIQPYRQIPVSAICTDDSIALALDAANQGMALLKNANATLPLSASKISSLAVIGPNAGATTTMQGNYYGSPCTQIVSPAAALSAYTTVSYVPGCDIASNDTSGFAAAVAAAQTADATVLIMGLDQTQEAEGHDRTILSFPGVQLDLIQAVAASAKGPAVLVMMNGGAVDITWPLASTNIGAILAVGYPGEMGGVAIAQTLFGDNVPAGRLTQTWYPAGYANAVSFFEMNMRPGPSVWPPFTSPGRTYRFYTGPVVLPFGFGLSYTTFLYGISGPGKVSLAPARKYVADNYHYHGARYAPLTSELAVTYAVNVTNTGSIAAADSVLLFITPPGAGQGGMPLQYLFNFQRVYVLPGQTVTVWLGLHARDLTHVDADGNRYVMQPGAKYTVRVGVDWPGAATATTSFVVTD